MPYNIFMSPQILTPQQLERLCCAQFDVEESHPGLDSPFLRLLASIERSQRSSLLSEVHCVPGEYLVCEGEPGDALYLIWSGRAAVYIGDIEAPTVLGYREPGEIIGEMALLRGIAHGATAVALEPTDGYVIGREAVGALTTRSDEASRRVAELIGRRAMLVLRREVETLARSLSAAGPGDDVLTVDAPAQVRRAATGCDLTGGPANSCKRRLSFSASSGSPAASRRRNASHSARDMRATRASSAGAGAGRR